MRQVDGEGALGPLKQPRPHHQLRHDEAASEVGPPGNKPVLGERGRKEDHPRVREGGRGVSVCLYWPVYRAC